MLHIVNKSPFGNSAMDECSRFLSGGADVILLIEDGVYSAKAGTTYEAKLKEILGKVEVYALEPDTKARGVDKLTDGVKLVDYSGFVDLVEKHKTHSWL
ncbi:tRNA 5-methylaminomethyl-2-thiouridine synthase subunit TusB [hydrothermal vent metagenome]|uniref:tRNA 5-methylaminomethyl-2-thiouridine synthase subunit TusB n=1 Tax=hydrothermal vent metagenome TaxID=652676 RepID=A0A3B1CPM3_9ZZZZ